VDETDKQKLLRGKTRANLPPEYQMIYERHYKDNRNGDTAAASMTQKMERWLHRQVAKDTEDMLSTLEIGAGTLNQLGYEKGNVYDIVEPFTALYEGSDKLKRIRTVYDYIENVPPSNKYNRIISCAALEHIENLAFVVSKSGLLLRDGGCFRAAVPSHGGFLWKISYTLTSGLEFRMRHHLSYSVIMNYEHINTVDEIEWIINFFYKEVKRKRLGLSKNLSFYSFFEARYPDLRRCNDYCSIGL